MILCNSVWGLKLLPLAREATSTMYGTLCGDWNYYLRPEKPRRPWNSMCGLKLLPLTREATSTMELYVGTEATTFGLRSHLDYGTLRGDWSYHLRPEKPRRFKNNKHKETWMTLNTPEMDRVRLEVCLRSRNSLNSSMKPRNPPSRTLLMLVSSTDHSEKRK